MNKIIKESYFKIKYSYEGDDLADNHSEAYVQANSEQEAMDKLEDYFAFNSPQGITDVFDLIVDGQVNSKNEIDPNFKGRIVEGMASPVKILRENYYKIRYTYQGDSLSDYESDAYVQASSEQEAKDKLMKYATDEWHRGSSHFGNGFYDELNNMYPIKNLRVEGNVSNKSSISPNFNGIIID